MGQKANILFFVGLIIVSLTLDANAQELMINEIMASNTTTIRDEDGDYPDWIELYNNDSVPINLNGYGLSDDFNESFKCTIPIMALISGRTGEVIKLYDDTGQMIDSIAYANRYPWPIMPDGGWPTLALKNPDMDNSLSISWAASQNHGSPGMKNSVDSWRSVDLSARMLCEFRLYPNYPNPFKTL